MQCDHYLFNFILDSMSFTVHADLAGQYSEEKKIKKKHWFIKTLFGGNLLEYILEV